MGDKKYESAGVENNKEDESDEVRLMSLRRKQGKEAAASMCKGHEALS